MFVRAHTTSPERVREAYDALYTQQWMPPRAALFDWVVRLLGARPGQLLLDVACGDAQLGQPAKRSGLIYYGIDLSGMAVRAAHAERVLVGEGAQLPFADDRFDRVASIGSLEHYLQIEQGVREIARVLKPDGMACVLVPNAFGLTWNALRVWRTGDLADDDEQPIQRFGTRGAWQRLLAENGLLVRRTLGYERSWPRTSAERQFYCQQPRELALSLLAPLLPINLTRCFVFLCTKSHQRQICYDNTFLPCLW
jgi:SAM-dependent methyltransferase